MTAGSIHSGIESISAGAWAVGVSGGADSVALLSLLRERADLRLHVTHLNHETRGRESAEDARFVEALCARWNIPLTIAGMGEIEIAAAQLPKNPSARFRRARIELFRRVVADKRLDGVILAHHADDQAETVLHRLLRSSGYVGLVGMSPRAWIAGLLVLRPMLQVRRDELRAVLRERNQPWREDPSNISPKHLRNRLRALLATNPQLAGAALELSRSCRALRDWARRTAEVLPAEFPCATLANSPPILARESARRWLIEQGIAPGRIDPAVVDRLLEMASDAASPARQHFPGRILIRRRSGRILRDDREDHHASRA